MCVCLYIYIYYVSTHTHTQASILEHQKEQLMLETKVGELEKANVALRCEGNATQKAVSELQGRLEKAELQKSQCPTLIDR